MYVVCVSVCVFVSVCVCICVYVCMLLYVCVFLSVCVSVCCMCVYVYVCVFLSVYVCVCMCVSICLGVCVFGSVCLTVCLSVCQYALKNRKFFKRNYGKIISNVSDFLSPIRLRNIPGTLAGVVARVSGWGRTSDSKYNFIIILYLI